MKKTLFFSLLYAAILFASCDKDYTSVSDEIAVTGVTLNKTSAAMLVGSTETLTATLTPANATNQQVWWYADPADVVSVNGDGVVTAKKAGKATITVITDDGGMTATCVVTLTTIAVESVALNKTALTLAEGKTERLTATILPIDATYRKVTWSTSPSDVATVSPDGTVTAKREGSATITATTEDGGKTATCAVTVTPTLAPGSFYYNNNTYSTIHDSKRTCIGIVFLVNEDGRTGKIVSLDQVNKKWSILAEEVNTTSNVDGAVNTNKILSLPKYSASNYPLFAWCKERNTPVVKGIYWYIPARREVSEMYAHFKAIDASLAKIGATGFGTNGSLRWSSTEYSAINAVYADKDNMMTARPKNFDGWARAISAF